MNEKEQAEELKQLQHTANDLLLTLMLEREKRRLITIRAIGHYIGLTIMAGIGVTFIIGIIYIARLIVSQIR